MNNTLLVLTDKYPYGLGETFIETERRYWSVFDKVIICPVLINNTDTIRNGFQCCDYETLINTTESRITILQIVKGLSGSVYFTDFIKEIKHNFRLQNIKNAFSMFVRSNLRFKRTIREFQKYISDDDRVLVYSYWMLEPALVGMGLKRISSGVRLITRAHGYDLYEERHVNSYIPFRKLVLDLEDAIYPVSENGVNYLNRRYDNKYYQKLFVERLGIIKLYKEKQEKREESSYLIVTCSNMIPLKRIDRLVEALRKCDKRIIWHHFGDGELMRDISLQVATLPQNIQVKLWGRVSNQEVQRFYADNHVDAFINVSEAEGVPVSIMEAQSYGIPVIATNVGGTSELVHGGENGVILKKDFTNEELLEAIQDVVIQRTKYSNNARKLWLEKSDASNIYPAFFLRELSNLLRI